jgi:hypothetical protein
MNWFKRPCHNYTGSMTNEILTLSVGGMRENLHGFHSWKRKTDTIVCQVLPDFRMTIISPLCPSGMSNE